MKALQVGRNVSTMEVANQIKEVAPDALKLVKKTIEGGLSSTDPSSLQVKAAMDILDRAGHTPIRKVQGVIATRIIPEAVMDSIKHNAHRAGIMSSEETPYEDITPKNGDSNANT